MQMHGRKWTSESDGAVVSRMEGFLEEKKFSLDL